MPNNTGNSPIMLSIFSVDLCIQYWFVMTWWKLFGRVIWWLLLRKRKPQENLFMVNGFQFSLCSLFDWGIHYLCFHRNGLNWDQLVITRSMTKFEWYIYAEYYTLYWWIWSFDLNHTRLSTEEMSFALLKYDNDLRHYFNGNDH